jgi:putative transposase
VPHVLRDTAAGRFHVYAHCVWAVPAYFHDDIDRLDFLRRFARLTAAGHWRCLGFCLMTSHYHLIVDVQDGALPGGMQRLNLGYSRTHNRRYGLRGHVQHDRYGARRTVDDADLLGVFKYVMMNPVEAGLCERPQDWPWSSYAATVGLAKPHTFVDPAPVLACFRWPDEDPVAALRAYVEGLDARQS